MQQVIKTRYQLRRAPAAAEYPVYVQIWNETADGCEHAAGRRHFPDFTTAREWMSEHTI